MTKVSAAQPQGRRMRLSCYFPLIPRRLSWRDRNDQTRKSEAQKYFRVSPQKDGGLREIEITKVAFNLLCSRSLDFAIVENKVIWPDEHDSLLSSEEKARVSYSVRQSTETGD
jgi:hypothetical protein